MRTKHLLEVALYDSKGILPGGEEFMAIYATQRSEKTTRFLFGNDATVREALSFLTQHQLDVSHFYVFELDKQEVASHPALYLGINMVNALLMNERVNARLMKNSDIAVDYQSERIVVSERTKGIFLQKTQDIIWSPIRDTSGQQWWLMKVTNALPEPIIVSSALSITANEEPLGTYAVRSDGRDIIAQTSIEFLKACGVARSLEVRISHKVLPWRPRLIASGAVIDALQRADTRGLLLPPFPLITVSHPLSFYDSIDG